MARTVKRGTTARGHIDPQAPVRNYYAREQKWARKSTNRKARRTAGHLLIVMSEPDDLVIPRNPSTGGWISH